MKKLLTFLSTKMTLIASLVSIYLRVLFVKKTRQETTRFKKRTKAFQICSISIRTRVSGRNGQSDNVAKFTHYTVLPFTINILVSGCTRVERRDIDFPLCEQAVRLQRKIARERARAKENSARGKYRCAGLPVAEKGREERRSNNNKRV